MQARLEREHLLGAIAKLKGWALRELSYRVPSLEQIFARIALGEEPQAARSEPVAQPPAGTVSPMPSVVQPASNALPVSQPAPVRQIYSLNPFDRGASRDLSAPVNVDAPAKVDAPQRPDA